MWFAAFRPAGVLTVTGVLTVVLSMAAMVLSTVAFAKEIGPQYEWNGSRVGLLFITLAILGYLAGTSYGSDALHIISLTTFYLGSVLYVGGTRSLLCALPSGLIMVLASFPWSFGLWGTIYLDGVSWVFIVASTAFILSTRNAQRSANCGLCDQFGSQGKAFCSSCGRQIGRVLVTVTRGRIVKFVIFSVIMIIVLEMTVPLAYTSPTVSLVSFGLGGTQGSQPFAPLPGWSATAIPPSNGSAVSGYKLSQGKTSMSVYLSTSQDSQSALSAIDSAKPNTTSYQDIPASLSKSIQGYTYKEGKTEYIGVEGVLPLGTPTGSGVTSAFVAIDLRQTFASFQADHGSALFGAASSVIGWSSSWGAWSVVAGGMLWVYQTFSQAAYLGSFSAFGVVLFTVARGDEQARARRRESILGLGGVETEILNALVSGPRVLTGAQLLSAVREGGNLVTDSTFYDALDELARRDLVSRSVVLGSGTPMLHWRRTF